MRKKEKGFLTVSMTRGVGFRLKGGRFRLDIRYKIFTINIREVKQWHKLPRDVGALSLETLEVMGMGL